MSAQNNLHAIIHVYSNTVSYFPHFLLPKHQPVLRRIQKICMSPQKLTNFIRKNKLSISFHRKLQQIEKKKSIARHITFSLFRSLTNHFPRFLKVISFVFYEKYKREKPHNEFCIYFEQELFKHLQFSEACSTRDPRLSSFSWKDSIFCQNPGPELKNPAAEIKSSAKDDSS